jgi:prepilin-type N-terminal cleavage/methylation domain-containing protein
MIMTQSRPVPQPNGLRVLLCAKRRWRFSNCWNDVQLVMRDQMNLRTQRGFSLLEMLTVVGIGMIIASVSFVTLMPALNKTHIDSAYDTTLSVLRTTRHLAVTQGHEYIVTFNPSGYSAGTIEVQFQPAAVGGIYPAVQLVSTYTIPTDTSFAVKTGFPGSTPDGYGTGILPIDFGYTPVGGTGGASTIVFMPDGSARDGTSPSNGGNYSGGVVYLTRPTGVITDSRAISVWGATGRIRGWRLNVISSTNTWVQQ